MEKNEEKKIKKNNHVIKENLKIMSLRIVESLSTIPHQKAECYSQPNVKSCERNRYGCLMWNCYNTLQSKSAGIH